MPRNPHMRSFTVRPGASVVGGECVGLRWSEGAGSEGTLSSLRRGHGASLRRDLRPAIGDLAGPGT